MLPAGLCGAAGEPPLSEGAVRAEIFGSSRRLRSASPPRGRAAASPPPAAAAGGFRRAVSCRRPREPRGSLHGAWVEREDPPPLVPRRGFSPPAQLRSGPDVREGANSTLWPVRRDLAPATKLIGAWPPVGGESHEESEGIRRGEIFCSPKRLSLPVGRRAFAFSSSDHKDEAKSFLAQAGDAAAMPRWPVLEGTQVVSADFQGCLSAQSRLHSALTRWPAPASDSPRQPVADGEPEAPGRPHEEVPCLFSIFGSPRRQLGGASPRGHLCGGRLAADDSPSPSGRSPREASPRAAPGPPGTGRPERALTAQRRHGLADIANCEECPAGRVSERGATLGSLCRECRPGFFSSATGARECQTCERGTYQDERSSTECKACPENTTSYPGSQNLTSCRCMSGYFSPSGVAGIACSPCPLGHQCIGEEMAPFAKEKYYGISQQVCIKCVSTMDSTPCLGGAEGGSSVGTLCKDGYEGVGCSHCSEGFFRFGRDCLECSPGEDWLMVYWVGLIIIFYLMRRVVNSKYKTLYIFLSFLQVFGLQGSFSLGWSARIKHTMRIIQVANLQVDLLMPSCEREINYPYKYLMYLVLPWFFLLVDMVVIFLNRLLKAMTSRGKGKKEPKEQVQEPAKLENADRAEEPGQSRAEGEDPGQLKTAISSLSEAVRNKPVAIAGTFADVAGINKRSSKDLLYDFLGQALVNMRLMYLSLCGRTLDMLQCTDMGEGLPPRLSKDMDLVCWDGLHSSFMPIVGIAGVFYIVGTPLAYIVILYRGYRSNTLYSREHVRRYGLLYSRFEPSFFFWELVIMLRRVLAVAIKTLLNIRTAEYQQSGYIGNYQAALTCSVMVIALALHFYARPFCNPFLDFGDAVFLGGTFLSCIIGICFSTARNETEYEAMELLFFLNLGLICTVAAALLYRDVEAVHPRVKRLRAKLAALLRCHVMYEWLRSRFHSQLRRKKAEATELVSGIKFEQLQQKPVLLRVFKSVLCHSVHEKLEDLGIEPDHIQVIMTPGDAPQTVLVRTIIVPPSGISPELVQIAMNNHSQAELVHSLMGGMMEAIASRTPPDKPPSVTI